MVFYDEIPEHLREEFETVLKILKNGMDNWICIRCGQPVAFERQSGCDVYAEPCGCRLWYGTARGRKPAELRGPKGGL